MTKSRACSVEKSAKCDVFLNLMKKSLAFCLWRRKKIFPGLLTNGKSGI